MCFAGCWQREGCASAGWRNWPQPQWCTCAWPPLRPRTRCKRNRKIRIALSLSHAYPSGAEGLSPKLCVYRNIRIYVFRKGERSPSLIRVISSTTTKFYAKVTFIRANMRTTTVLSTNHPLKNVRIWEQPNKAYMAYKNRISRVLGPNPKYTILDKRSRAGL